MARLEGRIIFRPRIIAAPPQAVSRQHPSSLLCFSPAVPVPAMLPRALILVIAAATLVAVLAAPAPADAALSITTSLYFPSKAECQKGTRPLSTSRLPQRPVLTRYCYLSICCKITATLHRVTCSFPSPASHFAH